MCIYSNKLKNKIIIVMKLNFRFLKKVKNKFYLEDLKELIRQKGSDTSFPFGKKFPILNERFESSGILSGHYFHQDLLVARKIFENNPGNHLDIGSRTDGFVAHIAVFRKIEVMDIRELDSKVKNIEFTKADLMKLPDNMLNKYDSISTLHVIEHFGLGRYGDPIDYYGHIKAIDNITKMLKTGGKLYFSTPIGPQRIEFNAHRVFSIQYLLNMFKEYYTVDSFSFVNDIGDLFENVGLEEKKIASNFDCQYGCGIFEFTKK